jgi:hypothetical protein
MWLEKRLKQVAKRSMAVAFNRPAVTTDGERKTVVDTDDYGPWDD